MDLCADRFRNRCFRKRRKRSRQPGSGGRDQFSPGEQRRLSNRPSPKWRAREAAGCRRFQRRDSYGLIQDSELRFVNRESRKAGNCGRKAKNKHPDLVNAQYPILKQRAAVKRRLRKSKGENLLRTPQLTWRIACAPPLRRASAGQF